MIDETIAFITCSCGKKIQVLKEPYYCEKEKTIILEWDEDATRLEYEKHTETEHN